jgi:hypothetical protein
MPPRSTRSALSPSRLPGETAPPSPLASATASTSPHKRSIRPPIHPKRRPPNPESPAAHESPTAPPTSADGELGDDAGDEPTFGATAEVEAPPREVTKRTIEGERLREIPGTRGDPLRAIEVMPGVGRTGLGDGAPRLRGAAGFDSLSLVDDVPVPLLYHFGGLTSIIHPALIEEVTLYPGNFPVTYGRATAGVVAADLRNPRTDRFHGMLDLSTVDSSVLLEFPIGDHLAFALAGRRSNIDLFFNAFVPEDAYDVVAAPVYYDYQAMGVGRFGDHELRLVGYGSNDRIELLFTEPNDEMPALRGSAAAEIGFHRVEARLDSQLEENVHQRLQLVYGILQGEQNLFGTRFDFLQHDFFGRAEWDATLAAAVSLRAGFDFRGAVLEGDYDGARPGQLEGDARPNDPLTERSQVSSDPDQETIKTLQPAAYVELGLRPVEPLLLLPGVRIDYFNAIDQFTVDPRLSARYALSDALTLKAGVGLYTQPPLYWETMDLLGDPNLDPIRALQVSAGTEYLLFDEALELGVEGFYKQLEDRVVATEGGVAPYFENDGDGRIFGVELSANLELARRFYGYLAYTLSRSERSDHGGPTRLFDQDQTHILSTAGTYRFGDSGWQLGARFRLVSGNPYTPIEGSVFDASSGLYLPIYGAPNSARRATFHQLDVRVEKEWLIDPVKLTAYIEVLNTYSAQPEEGQTFSYDYRQSKSVPGLPLFPNIGLRGEL